jgi:hypothetical protein
MQPISATSGNLKNNPHNITNFQTSHNASHSENVTQENKKSTEFVQNVKKSEKNFITNEKIDKKIDNNIARSNVEEQQVIKLEKTNTSKLEAKKQYDTSDLSFAEIALKEKETLDSVKSVEPDGTETYYFPVPVEILTQLPPPGNIGISAKMLEDMIKDPPQETEIKQEKQNNSDIQAKNNAEIIDKKKEQEKVQKQLDNKKIVLQESQKDAVYSNNSPNKPPTVDYGIA